MLKPIIVSSLYLFSTKFPNEPTVQRRRRRCLISLQKALPAPETEGETQTAVFCLCCPTSLRTCCVLICCRCT